MQTLTNSALEFRRDDTQVVIFAPSGQNLGHIGFDITRNQWCYVPYGQPIKTTGTLEACQSAAEADYTEQQSHEATVTHIDADAKPAYVHRPPIDTEFEISNSDYYTLISCQNWNLQIKCVEFSIMSLRLRSLVSEVQVRDFSLRTSVLDK